MQSLNLSRNQLTALPESLGQLTQLQSLDLGGNQLVALPDWLGQLTQLEDLNPSGNQLTALPESLAELAKLRRLNLFSNKFDSLPDWVSQFISLESLGVGNNPLRHLPESLSRCQKLEELDLGDHAGGCILGELPTFIRHLPRLEVLYAHACGLRSIPEWLGELSKLRILSLEQNPLNPELAAAYKGGLDAVKRYLREMAKGARKRYEAKLLILGDGNEGKTCVSRALRGLPFRAQKTTHGVDVEQWKFVHPDDATDRAKDITLNIWDLRGRK